MAIKNSSFHQVKFDNTSLDIFNNLYLPDSDYLRGTIIILHGMQEHSGRYHEFTDFLSNSGFAVLTYDHPGHGKTAKEKDDLGFFHANQPGELMIHTGIVMSEFLNGKHPELPHFIIGHSLGSFVTRNVVQRIGEQFHGVVLIGTGHAMKGSALGTMFLGLLNKVVPKIRSRFMNDKFGEINNRKFKDEANHENLNWLSLSKENRDSYLSDELSGIDFTDNAFYGAAQLMLWGSGSGWYKKVPNKLPFLLISGEDDPIGDFGKGVITSAEELIKHGNKDIKYHLYPKLRHEILNEDIKEEVYKEILKWIEDRMGR